MNTARTFSVGDVCGRYEVQASLETDEPVELYQAVDVASGDGVTLECSRWCDDSIDVDIDELLRSGSSWEARVGGGVIRTVDGGTTADGTPWLAHEPVPVDGVRARIAASGALPPALAVWLAQGIAERLAAVIDSGASPTPITPNAVRLRPDGSIALWLVRLSKPNASYTPPEMLSGHALDARAFVYGVALLLYEMLSGEHAFARYVRGESDVEAAMKHAQSHREPVRLSEYVPDLAPGVIATLRASLSKERAKRPPTLAAFATELARLREHVLAPQGELPTGHRDVGPRRAPTRETPVAPARTSRQAIRWGASLGIGAALLLELLRRWWG